VAIDLTNLLRRNAGVEAAVRWHVTNFLISHPWVLVLLGARPTIFNVFGRLGDKLLTAVVCRYLNLKYLRICSNFLTTNPELIRCDPNVDKINQPESYVNLWLWYLDRIERKVGESHVLSPTFERRCLQVNDYLLAFNTLPSRAPKRSPKNSEEVCV
jgi:hypothetical protein